MKRKLYYQSLSALFFGVALFLGTSCEGPVGPAGIDANESCKQCHNPNVVSLIEKQYEFSKHSYGEAAFDEAGNTGCTPCHTTEGFQYVCKNNVSASFIANPDTTKPGTFVNGYATVASSALGEFKCNTCHMNLHTAYDTTDFFPLTTTAPVAMTMWGGTKTINLTQDNSLSNLCVKCHQPRPLTSLKNGNFIDYADLVANPTDLVFTDSTKANKSKNIISPSYRTHVHYGGVGAIYAGKGGVEFTGIAYENSEHTTVASCQECHMADVSNRAGGHTFMVRGTTGALGSSTTWNFKGCNVSGCHDKAPLSATSSKFVKTRVDVKTLLESLASKLKSNGTEFLHKNSDATTNAWAGITKNNYDGYLDIYDPSTNPSGVWGNPNPSSFSKDAKVVNNTLPQFPSITKVQLGALINFQLCLREYSLGIHNTKYSTALLTNSIQALTDAGFN